MGFLQARAAAHQVRGSGLSRGHGPGQRCGTRVSVGTRMGRAHFSHEGARGAPRLGRGHRKGGLLGVALALFVARRVPGGKGGLC